MPLQCCLGRLLLLRRRLLDLLYRLLLDLGVLVGQESRSSPAFPVVPDYLVVQENHSALGPPLDREAPAVPVAQEDLLTISTPYTTQPPKHKVTYQQ